MELTYLTYFTCILKISSVVSQVYVSRLRIEAGTTQYNRIAICLNDL
jgi:hypothetical protein